MKSQKFCVQNGGKSIMRIRRHSDKNNRYLDFVQTRGLISLVNDNHVENNLKEILVNVYYGSIFNN